MPGWQNELEDARRLLVAAEKQLGETILKLPGGPQRGRLMQDEFVDVRRGYEQMGGLVASLSENVRRIIEADSLTEAEVIRVPTRPLADILADQGSLASTIFQSISRA